MSNMIPKVIIHNSLSLDGSLTGFEPDMSLHYQIAGTYKSAVHLVGSETAKTGLDLFNNGIPREEAGDFLKPDRRKSLPFWAIPDTKGKLMHKLHVLRRFEFCRDVIVLVSEATPKEYIEYLEERKYGFYVLGKDKVDLKQALEFMYSKLAAKRVLADTGRILSNLLLAQHLADELSLLIHPVIVGEKTYNMFGDLRPSLKLVLKSHTRYSNGLVGLVYGIVK